MESKQDYPPQSAQYPNQLGYQQQGNDQMYAAPPAYSSTAQYQLEPAYSAPLQYQSGLVIVQLNF